MKRWTVIRQMTNTDGLQTLRSIGIYATEWEAHHAAKIFEEAHPTALVGAATFCVSELNDSKENTLNLR
jgi:hypothetical protein